MKRVGWIVLLSVLSVVAMAGGAAKFSKIRIVFMRNGTGDFYNPPRKYVTSDPAKVEAFVACLAGLGGKTLPLKPAGWSARATVELIPVKGPSTMVYLSGDYGLWSMRGATGDARPKAALKPILADAGKQAKPLSP